jgi:hypothetical protein
MISNPRFFKQAPYRSILLGAIGFGLGNFLAAAITEILSRVPNDFNPVLWPGTVLATLAGAIGGAMLGFADSTQNKIGLFALAGAIGFGAGTYLTIFAFLSVSESRVSNLVFDIIGVAHYPLMGALTGILLGCAQKNWKQMWRLALAGSVGFTLGFFAFILVTDVMGRIIGGTPSSFLMVLTVSGGGAALGGVGGAFLGWAWEKPHNNLRLKPSGAE